MSTLLKFAKPSYTADNKYLRDPVNPELDELIASESRDEIMTHAMMYQVSGAWLSDWMDRRVQYYREEKEALNVLIDESKFKAEKNFLREQRNTFSHLEKKYRKASDSLLKASEVYETMLMKKMPESKKDDTESIHNILIDIFSRLGSILAHNDFSSEAMVAVLNPTETVVAGKTIIHNGNTYLPIIK